MRYIQECSTLSRFTVVEIPSATDSETVYQVILPPWDRTEEDVVCDCPSYEYRGRCRHQREALGKACKWSELDGVPQEQAGVCPECESDTVTVVLNGDE